MTGDTRVTKDTWVTESTWVTSNSWVTKGIRVTKGPWVTEGLGDEGRLGDNGPQVTKDIWVAPWGQQNPPCCGGGCSHGAPIPRCHRLSQWAGCEPMSPFHGVRNDGCHHKGRVTALQGHV